MEIILARHGETDWNVAEVFRGKFDIELNETGLKQAELLAEYLSSSGFDAIYSSPLKRSVKTAEAIAGNHNVRVNIAPGLDDFDYGEWQGLAHLEVKEKYWDLYSRWINHPEQIVMPSGESLDNVRDRAMPVVDELVHKDEGTVLLLSHRVVNKVIICALLGLDNSHFWDIKLDTCGITRFTCENGHSILTGHNDTSFLRPIQKAPLSDF
ncbi:histidine phosphatase family protein [Chloroflexota bacterium]